MPLIITAQNNSDIKHIKNVYYEVKKSIDFSIKHKYEGKLYCNVTQDNVNRRAWSDVGVYYSKIEYWYGSNPYMVDDEDVTSCLDMVIAKNQVAAVKYYVEYLFEKGQLIFVYYKMGDEEVRLYYKNKKLIKKIGDFKDKYYSYSEEEIQNKAKRYMYTFLFNFNLEKNHKKK